MNDKTKGGLRALQYRYMLELNNPLNHGKTVRNLTLLECLRFQCAFPIGFCNDWLLGCKYEVCQETQTLSGNIAAFDSTQRLHSLRSKRIQAILR